MCVPNCSSQSGEHCTSPLSCHHLGPVIWAANELRQKRAIKATHGSSATRANVCPFSLRQNDFCYLKKQSTCIAGSWRKKTQSDETQRKTPWSQPDDGSRREASRKIAKVTQDSGTTRGNTHLLDMETSSCGQQPWPTLLTLYVFEGQTSWRTQPATIQCLDAVVLPKAGGSRHDTGALGVGWYAA